MPTGQPNSEGHAAASAEQPAAPRRAVREIRRAEQLAERGQIPEAIETLRQALRLGADRYTCLLRMARLYQSRKQLPEAVSAAEQAIAENPGRLSAREAVIAFHLEARDYERAVEASKALLKLSPRHIPARDALGAAYIGLGDLDAAMRVINELIRIDPTSPSHRFTRAHLAQHRGEVGLAVEEFERVLSLADEGELADAARDQLATLDSMQIEQILALASEDTIFRVKLLREAAEAAAERGFCLSSSGSETLEDIVSDSLADLDAPCRPTLYH